MVPHKIQLLRKKSNTMTPIKIYKKRQESKQLFLIQALVPEFLYKTYQIPGQYAILSTDQKNKIYLSFANAPRNTPNLWEFLIKKEGEVANKLLELKEDDEFYLLNIEGKGFPIEKIKNQNLECFAMGSGIAPIRALIQYIYQESIPLKHLELWVCSFTENHQAFKKDLKHWEELFNIHYIYDQIPPYKNVIQILKESNRDYRGKLVIWIGSQQFGNDLWNVLKEKNLAKEAFITNI